MSAVRKEVIGNAELWLGDCRGVLPMLPGALVQTCVTSPPYFNLRDYGVFGQIGLEASPDAYIAEMVNVFREVRRVLRDDGTCWLNLGDSYGSGKQLLGMPWRVALALQGDGWILRSAITWAKPNPMPESVRDRPTNAHESVFLLTKRQTYFYDAEAVKEPATSDFSDSRRGDGAAYSFKPTVAATHMGVSVDGKRNLRNVWNITPQPFSGAHFATMPPELAERCILAGTRYGDAVLDPFGGSGTTGFVASRLGRRATLVELNPDYYALARDRIEESQRQADLFVRPASPDAAYDRPLRDLFAEDAA